MYYNNRCVSSIFHIIMCFILQEQTCAIQVYVVPWLGTNEVTKNSCGVISNINNTLKREKRGLGGPIEVDPSSPEVQEVAGHAVSAFAAKSNSMYSIRLHQVRKVTKHVRIRFCLNVSICLCCCSSFFYSK